MEKTKQGRYTKEEENIIKKNYGVCSLDKIAKMLNRDIVSLKRKVYRLGLSYTNYYQGAVTAYQLAGLLNVDSHTVLRWINNKGLHCNRKILALEREHILIEIPRFWQWIEKNQSQLNFSKINRGVLLPEPEWLDAAVERDSHAIPRKTQQLWTPEEDARIWRMFYVEQKTQAEIGRIEGRSRRGVQKRLSYIRDIKEKQKERNLNRDDLNTIKFV
ncbi:hypothetical protein bcgnr5372_38470 [Bacillus luti]|nr:hypothetical protein [Bacillus cereus]HDR8327229.1 hypothetical protein [Bacillus cereus]HDR8336419.1 hypothetical protein [Bacillus cereus]